MPSDRRIAVLGLGYVGLPVATTFARAGFPVIGFDIDSKRVGGATARAWIAPARSMPPICAIHI